jgi:ERCC4-type nuclease
MTWSMIWNYIRSQQHKGITIEITLSMDHTIQRINELYAWYQKPFHTGGLNKGSYTDDRILAFPSGCRGKTAKSVLDTFKSLQAIGNAEEYDFTYVEGIGEKKAKLIYDHFHRGLNLNEVQLVEQPKEEVKKEEQLQGTLFQDSFLNKDNKEQNENSI